MNNNSSRHTKDTIDENIDKFKKLSHSMEDIDEQLRKKLLKEIN